MGQRLNIEIHNNGELLANCYYHWSAYTDSALELATDALDALYGELCEKLENPKQKAIVMLYATGAGMQDKNELLLAKNIMKGVDNWEFPDKFEPNRNDGLINITKEGMQETRDWEEGRVVIDIGREVIDFNVMFTCDEDELEEEEVKSIEDLNYYTREVPFRDWDSFKDDLENIGCYFKDLDNDCIMGKIQ